MPATSSSLLLHPFESCHMKNKRIRTTQPNPCECTTFQPKLLWYDILESHSTTPALLQDGIFTHHHHPYRLTPAWHRRKPWSTVNVHMYGRHTCSHLSSWLHPRTNTCGNLGISWWANSPTSAITLCGLMWIMGIFGTVGSIITIIVRTASKQCRIITCGSGLAYWSWPILG